MRIKTPLRFAFAALSLLTFISAAHATTPTQHYSATFSASVYTAVASGTDATVLKVTKISNAKIFSQLVASGSFSGETAANMAIVLNNADNDVADVIDKSTHATLFPLIVSGTDFNEDGQVIYGHAGGKFSAIVSGSFIVNLPDGSTFNTIGLLRVAGGGGELTVLNASASFTGGSGNKVIQGSFRKHGKTYTY